MEMLRDGLHHSLKENEERLKRLEQPELKQVEMEKIEEEASTRIDYATERRELLGKLQAKLKELESACSP